MLVTSAFWRSLFPPPPPDVKNHTATPTITAGMSAAAINQGNSLRRLRDSGASTSADSPSSSTTTYEQPPGVSDSLCASAEADSAGVESDAASVGAVAVVSEVMSC